MLSILIFLLNWFGFKVLSYLVKLEFFA